MTWKKCFIVLFYFTIAGCAVRSQPAVKIYAFEQTVLPGNIPVNNTEETGNPQTTPQHTFNYYLYFTYSGAAVIEPNKVWIKGVAYHFEKEIITTGSVTRTLPDGTGKAVTTVLVPATKNKIVQLKISAVNSTAKLTALEKKKTTGAAVVVAYIWKGKKQYSIVETFQRMPSAVHQ